MTKKLTEAQKIEIAKRWAGGMLKGVDLSSFNTEIGIRQKDQQDILNVVYKIGEHLIGDKGYSCDLNEIIQQALNN
jgi:hypothetical protein